MTEYYEYKLVSFVEIESAADVFKAVFRVNVQTREQFVEWRNAFQSKSITQYTIRKTQAATKFSIFHQYLCCHHNVHKGKVRKDKHKHTVCPTQLNVKIIEVHKTQSKYPCMITLTWNHNHPINAADVVRRQTVNTETDAKLEYLYEHGHTPISARQFIRIELEDTLENNESLHYKLASRSIYPDYHHCEYIFKRLFGKRYGKQNDNVRLAEFISRSNLEMGELCIVHEEYVDSTSTTPKFIIAMCTPFMRRVHIHIQEAAEIVFVDASGGFDRDGYRIFLFMTHSKAGGKNIIKNHCDCQ